MNLQTIENTPPKKNSRTRTHLYEVNQTHTITIIIRSVRNNLITKKRETPWMWFT